MSDRPLRKVLDELLEEVKDYKMTQKEIIDQGVALMMAEARFDGDTTLTRKEARAIIEAQWEKKGVTIDKKQLNGR